MAFGFPIRQTKKVRIVSCNSATFWYVNEIGKVFRVYINPKKSCKYQVEYDSEFDQVTIRLLNKVDCKDCK